MGKPKAVRVSAALGTAGFVAWGGDGFLVDNHLVGQGSRMVFIALFMMVLTGIVAVVVTVAVLASWLVKRRRARPETPEPDRGPDVQTALAMAVPKGVHEAKGLWKGTSHLNRSWMAEGKRVSESPSRLHVEANDAYATIAYTWTVDGGAQEGTLLLAMDEKTGAVDVGWTDTWHQSSGVMHLVGDLSESGAAVRTKGSFRAGEETWGWTIDLALADGALSLTMANVTPKGAAEWAVRATYQRE